MWLSLDKSRRYRGKTEVILRRERTDPGRVGKAHGKTKPVRSFEDLRIWQMGIDLVKRVYVLTARGTFGRDFGLRVQIRRASVSIPTNIAEGFERSSRKEYLLFLNIAKGSAGEVRSLAASGL